MMARIRGSLLLLAMAGAGSRPVEEICVFGWAWFAAEASAALRSRLELKGSRQPATIVPAIFRHTVMRAQ